MTEGRTVQAVTLSHTSPDFLDERATFVPGSEVFQRVNFFVQCSGRNHHYSRHGVAQDWKALTEAINDAQTFNCPCKKTVTLTFNINVHGL